MDRRSLTGGVVGKGRQRIQYDFRLNGVRYRPTLKAIPTEANLRRARKHLKAIKERIRWEHSRSWKSFRISAIGRNSSLTRRIGLAIKSSINTSRTASRDSTRMTCHSRLLRVTERPSIRSGGPHWAPCPSSRSNTPCCYVSPFRITSGTRKPTTTRSVRYAVPSSSATAIILNISIRPRP